MMSLSLSPMSLNATVPLPTPQISITSDEGKQLELERVKGLWFKDGNIVVVAPPKSFKVYQGFFSAHSNVFKDMLEFPPPADGQDSMEGCPVVRLSDRGDEVESFLRAIFIPLYFETLPETSLIQLTSITRLAHKYDVPQLVHHALKRISSLYPTSFKSIKTNLATHTFNAPITSVPISLEEHFRVLEAAREVHADWLLPSVYYSIIRAATLWTILSHPCVSEPDRILFSAAYTKQNLAALGVARTVDDTEYRLCTSPAICESEKAARYSNVESTLSKSLSSPFLPTDPETGTQMEIVGASPLTLFTKADFEGLKDELCKSCYKDTRETYHEESIKFWDELPKMCGLDVGWKRLVEIKDEVLQVTASEVVTPMESEENAIVSL